MKERLGIELSLVRTSDVAGPQQLSPDTTWAEPSTAKSKLAKDPRSLNHS